MTMRMLRFRTSPGSFVLFPDQSQQIQIPMGLTWVTELPGIVAVGLRRHLICHSLPEKRLYSDSGM